MLAGFIYCWAALYPTANHKYYHAPFAKVAGSHSALNLSLCGPESRWCAWIQCNIILGTQPLPCTCDNPNYGMAAWPQRSVQHLLSFYGLTLPQAGTKVSVSAPR